MIYKPSKKEVKQIKELNKGYNLLKKGFDIIIENSPKKDGDVGVYAYRASKNIEALIKRVYNLLEIQYVDNQFFDIVKNIENKKEK
jgi:predicted adenine nucleotide alpha hydrolase (AANH) superfamily ATPase